MTEDEQWFSDQGFGVEVEQAEPDLYWAHLVNRDSRRRVAPDYGRGTTANESVASARRRYEVEQLGA
jgi:hypothetical protein